MNKSTLSTMFLTNMTIFYAVMIGHTAFALTVVFVLKGAMATIDPANNNLLYLAIALSITAVSGGYMLYKSKVDAIPKGGDALKKLTLWRSAFILKIALIDAACLFHLVFLMLTNNRIYLYLYILMAVIMLLNKPMQSRIMEELQIGRDQV